MVKYVDEKHRHGSVKTKSIQLRKTIFHQIHADLASERNIGKTPIPTEWTEDYNGFYRSAVCAPYYAHVGASAETARGGIDVTSEVHSHFVAMQQAFESWKDSRFDAREEREQMKNQFGSKLGLKIRPKKRKQENPAGAPIKSASKSDEVSPAAQADSQESDPEINTTLTPKRARVDHRRVPSVIQRTSHRLGPWRYSKPRLTEQTQRPLKNINYDYSECAFAAKRLCPRYGNSAKHLKWLNLEPWWTSATHNSFQEMTMYNG
jgi:hypothetical protein